MTLPRPPALPRQPPVELHWLEVGRCRQFEALARRGGRYRLVDFPSHCAAIHHPRAGWVLFDTGYSQAFRTATAAFPQRLYRAALPVTLPAAQALPAQLSRLGAAPGDIGRVVVSHFHGDHVAGLRDLPHARVSAGAAGMAQILGSRAGWRHGLLPALLPPDLSDRFDPVEGVAPVPVVDGTGHDLLGDGSLIAVPLPGHLPGHLGLLLTAAVPPPRSCRPVLLVGDAAWSLRAIREQAPPGRLAAAAVHDGKAAAATLATLHRWQVDHPELVVLPAHCPEAAAHWREVSGCAC